MRVNVDNAPPWTPGPGIRQFLTVVDHGAQSGIPASQPGTEITDKTFSEKTPEESDDSCYPLVLRGVLTIMGGFNDHFLLLFRTFSHRFAHPEHRRYLLVSGGLGAFLSER